MYHLVYSSTIAGLVEPIRVWIPNSGILIFVKFIMTVFLKLGHRDINTTRIYLRLSDEDAKREVSKVKF